MSRWFICSHGFQRRDMVRVCRTWSLDASQNREISTGWRAWGDHFEAHLPNEMQAREVLRWVDETHPINLMTLEPSKSQI